MSEIIADELNKATLLEKVRDDYVLREAGVLLFPFRVGEVCRVGSVFARTFGPDWWQTSTVKRIILEYEDPAGFKVVEFETMSGSLYKLQFWERESCER
jgi:ABC-type hemin transport system ATPase subunit